MWGRILDEPQRSAIVDLVPFDVTIGLKEDTNVDVFALTDIVEDWLGNAFSNNTLGDSFAQFATVILDNQDPRFLVEKRELQATFVASYEGVTVWTRTGDLVVPDNTVVATIQTQAFIDDDELLLEALQSADSSTGLGDAVTNVKASINNNNNNDGGSTSPDDSLDLIIIIAIAIAGLAFCLLGFALFMVWRNSRSERMKELGSPAGAGATGDESEIEDSVPSKPGSKRLSAAAAAATSPPKEIEPGLSGLYPDSVISEDISTSLTAYYQSGIGGRGRNGPGKLAQNNFNDAASVSSMESYGYSLDGYTNSIAPTNDKDELY